MAGVAVVTDSTHYLPADVVQRHGIQEVSLYVGFKGEVRREADITDFDAFYEELRSASELPSTSQPSIGDFMTVYEPLLEAGREVLSVHISGEISGTVRAAGQARDTLVERGIEPTRIHVLDSRSGCATIGLMAIAAANAARDGADLAAAAAAAQRMREAMKGWFGVDTLEYLRRGGRIGAAGAWVGTALKIKPILTIDGTIVPVERVRTARRAFERMVEYMHDRRDAGCDVFFIQHIQAPEVAEQLAEHGRAI